MSNIDLANFDRMLELAEFGAKRHNERRQSAFKVIIAYITLLALTLYQTIENAEEFEFPGRLMVSLVVFLFCVVHGCYLIWLWMTIKALINDVRRRDFYLAKAESLSYHLSRSRFSDFYPDPNKNVSVNLGGGKSWKITEQGLFKQRGPKIINNARCKEPSDPKWWKKVYFLILRFLFKKRDPAHCKEPSDPKWWKEVHFLTLAVVPKVILAMLIYKLFF